MSNALSIELMTPGALEAEGLAESAAEMAALLKEKLE